MIGPLAKWQPHVISPADWSVQLSDPLILSGHSDKSASGERTAAVHVQDKLWQLSNVSAADKLFTWAPRNLQHDPGVCLPRNALERVNWQTLWSHLLPKSTLRAQQTKSVWIRSLLCVLHLHYYLYRLTQAHARCSDLWMVIKERNDSTLQLPFSLRVTAKLIVVFGDQRWQTAVNSCFRQI